MILDKNLLFSSAQALTATAASTDVIDLANARDISPGEKISGFVLVTTVLESAGASTLQVMVQGSTDNSTYNTYWESEAIAKASLTAGTRIDFEVPRPTPGRSLPRYMRLTYTVAVANFTGGAVTAGLVLGRDDQRAYPPGIAVSN